MRLNPYLTFNGNCEQAIKFYEKVLGGTIETMMAYGDSPAAEHTPPNMAKIMHARLKVGDVRLMASDAPHGNYEPMKGISVTLNIEEPAEADRIYNALSDKGAVVMAIQETFWAKRFAMFTDQFGTPWMINCEKPM